MAVKRGDRLEIQQCRPDLGLHQRHLIQDGVYDAFTKRFAETAGAVKVADGFEPGAVIGPLIDMKAVEKVEAHIMASAAFFENAPYV